MRNLLHLVLHLLVFGSIGGGIAYAIGVAHFHAFDFRAWPEDTAGSQAGVFAVLLIAGVLMGWAYNSLSEN